MCLPIAGQTCRDQRFIAVYTSTSVDCLHNVRLYTAQRSLYLQPCAFHTPIDAVLDETRWRGRGHLYSGGVSLFKSDILYLYAAYSLPRAVHTTFPQHAPLPRHPCSPRPCCSTYTNAVSACRGRTGRIGRCLASHNIIAGWHYFAHLIAKRLRHSYTQVYRVIDIDSRYAWDQANLDLASDSAIMKPCAYYAML
jgi:hypothetical protein